MYDNPFVLPVQEYKRDLNVKTHAVSDYACYLNLMTGQPLEKCHAHVVSTLKPGGLFAFKDPNVMYLERGENGDRTKKVGKMSEYMADTIKSRDLIAPTFTTYLHPTVKKSLLVDYIDDNVAARGVAKKAMFKAKREKDKMMETTKKIEQNYKKINNNSISGAHVSPSTPLYNKTGHSSLTSTCRVTSGYGNANNEKFLCGNRHYWSPEITRNNIVSIVNHTDYKTLNNAMQKFDLRHPTLEETIACVKYSTDLYWPGNQYEFQRIELLLSKLTPIQRSAFVYTGDLYHLMKSNPEFVQTFITKLATLVEVEHQDAETVFKNAPTDHRHLAVQIYRKEMKGKDLDKIQGQPAYRVLASTVENIGNVLTEYADIIKALWVTPNVPSSVAYLPQMLRRSAITSDTDSTIFTVQDWVLWHRGRIGFDDFSRSVGAVMIFLAAQTITHVLARMSANFGIEESRIFQIAMKNEYAFDVFVATQVAKHYYAFIGCQEGDLREEHEAEIKGVHLKSSKAPKVIMKQAENMMIRIMDTVMAEEQIDLQAILKEIGDLERQVIESIRIGSHEYFSFTQVKGAEGYTKGPFQSNYIHYMLWDEVFAPKYGKIEDPPFTCVKISVQLNTPSKVKEWLLNMKDRELAARMEAFMLKSGKKNMTTFWLPVDIVSTKGIPEEIFGMINTRKIIIETTKVFYLILETLGVSLLDKKLTRLVSDFY